MEIKSVLKIAFGTCLIFFLLYTIGFGRLAQTIVTANPIILVSAFLITPVTMSLRFIRWKFLTNTIKAKIPFLETVKIYLIGFFFGTITPSKIGDFVKFYYLSKKQKIKPGTSLSIAFLDRAFDLLIIFITAIIGMIFIFLATSIYTLNMLILPAFIVIFLLLLYLVFNEKTFTFFTGFFISKFTSIKKHFKLKKEVKKEKLIKELYLPFRSLKKDIKSFTALLLISIFIWISLALQATLILESLGTSIEIIYVFIFICIASVITLIPVTISGLGTRDLTLIFLFSLLAITSDKIILMSLLYYIFGQIIPAIAGGLVYLKE